MRNSLIVMSLFMISVFLMPDSVIAGAVGSSMPDLSKTGFGMSATVEENYVADRDLNAAGSISSGEVMESNQIYAKIGFQPLNYVNLYGNIGTANLEAEYEFNNGVNHKIEYDYGLLVGGGINIVYELVGDFDIGWDNQINWWSTDSDLISGDNTPAFTKQGTVDNYDAQSTVYVKYDADLLNQDKMIGYAGLCFSYFRSQHDTDGAIETQDSGMAYSYGDIENDNSIGLVAGFNYLFNERLSLSLEGRFISETAGTVSGTYRF